MIEPDYYIYPGRFQPPHRDHADAIKEALGFHAGLIYIGLIVHSPEAKEPDTQFEAEARRQNSPERNPFTFDQRRQMLEALFEELFSSPERSRLRLIPIPRPEAAWHWICSVFSSGTRHWIIPDCGEKFDEMKAEFFHQRGDRVVRVKQEPTTDGRTVRALLERRDPEVRQHVPGSVYNKLVRWNYVGGPEL